MPVEFYCTRWGSETISWELFCKKLKDAGYDGIEYGIARSATKKELDEVWNCAGKHQLRIIAQHYDTYEADFNQHFDLYQQWLEKIKPYPCAKINSQTGKDFFSFDQNKKLVEAATGSGLNILHETHRNKFSFAAHVTKTYLQSIPSLQLALDISHWVCVAESFLADQEEAVSLALERTEHIHARVGYPEGPQVPDPRMPEYREALEKHLQWWDRIAERKRKENGILSVTPEFGPFPYMAQVPATGRPITDQWEVNLYMMQLLKERYA